MVHENLTQSKPRAQNLSGLRETQLCLLHCHLLDCRSSKLSEEGCVPNQNISFSWLSDLIPLLLGTKHSPNYCWAASYKKVSGISVRSLISEHELKLLGNFA